MPHEHSGSALGHYFLFFRGYPGVKKWSGANLSEAIPFVVSRNEISSELLVCKMLNNFYILMFHLKLSPLKLSFVLTCDMLKANCIINIV